MTDILKERERAFEYEFFHKVDEQLWQRLRTKMDRECHRQALADATGINDEQVLDELIASDINGETILALAVFPLVWVAWADGHIDRSDHNAIMRSAEAAGIVEDTASHHMVESWLEQRPSETLQTAWEDYVRYLAKTMRPAVFRVFRSNLRRRTHEFADAICFRYGFHDAEAAQDAILDRIERTLAGGLLHVETPAPSTSGVSA